MDPLKIIQKYYEVGSKSYEVLLEHSGAVTKKSIEIANKNISLDIDLKFLAEAAMLHDIWIFMTNYPRIWCTGDYKYICHGYLWREILDKEWYPKHALVCERHTGVWLTVKDIEKQNLPIPRRDMVPISLEEQIICLADKFFSKSEDSLSTEMSLEKITSILSKYWDENTIKFNQMLDKFWLNQN